MTVSAKSHEEVAGALSDLYDRAGGAVLTRDARRLAKHYRKTLDEHIAAAPPMTAEQAGLLPTHYETEQPE